jgi:hypothetical protein
MMNFLIFCTLRTLLAHLVLQIKVRMLLWTQNAGNSIKVRLIFWTVGHTVILLNILIVNVHPLILGSALEN